MRDLESGAIIEMRETYFRSGHLPQATLAKSMLAQAILARARHVAEASVVTLVCGQWLSKLASFWSGVPLLGPIGSDLHWVAAKHVGVPRARSSMTYAARVRPSTVMRKLPASSRRGSWRVHVCRVNKLWP